MMPSPREKETFRQDIKAYVTEREFIKERTAFHARELYRDSFEFMSQFVLTIEVMLNGQLQSLHFQRPLTEMWYVHGQAKEEFKSAVDRLMSGEEKVEDIVVPEWEVKTPGHA